LATEGFSAMMSVLVIDLVRIRNAVERPTGM